MPVFQLGSEPVFPPVRLAEPEGLLAVGGDLSLPRLLAAYRSGIFPWYSADQPILWWAPDPRCVLFPDNLKVSKSLARVIKSGRYRVTHDRAFVRVISECGTIRRKGQTDTWITDAMMDAYSRLHEAGYAHSVEVWHGAELAGGLYGVSLGRIFFGESMFARMADASKVGLVDLVSRLKERGFSLVDCQVHTDHMQSMGAVEIPRAEFMRRLSILSS